MQSAWEKELCCQPKNFKISIKLWVSFKESEQSNPV